MKTYQLRTATGRCIARNVHMACSFQSRCLGLLRHSTLPKDEGLLLVPGGSIHTLGMRFPIDVVFLNRQMRILDLAEQVRPWRIRVAPRDTRRVLELAAGQIAANRLARGIYLIVDTETPGRTDSSAQPNIKPPQRVGPCERLPIQFSLRLPLERNCARTTRTRCASNPHRTDGRPTQWLRPDCSDDLARR